MPHTAVEKKPDQAQVLLSNYFGYDQFRHYQAEIIDNVVSGSDALVLMPTGGGKSLCYQIPALIRDGVGVVISPLIALMKDQVDSLQALGIRGAFINSSQDFQTRRGVERDLLEGRIDLLYIAPERLFKAESLNLLSQATVALFAIDEAHCVSQWGHDFRPEYQQLKILAERFPGVPRIALTATADQRTRQEIVEQLSLHKAKHFIHSFDRPNISYTIADGGQNKQKLWKFLEHHHANDAGIVYCLSRKKVDDIAAWLSDQGRPALPYHAGLSNDVRAHNQSRFLKEEGLIIVATIAFGMGIDKPDVRFVAHLNLPKSIEAYYQETGRAGRDGEPANAWMAYQLNDVITLSQMLQASEGSEQYKRVTLQKLDAMLALCEMTGCRRQALLGYFNESLARPCGNCDNCLNPPVTWDGTEAAQKALSCVYRTGQRFGVSYLVDVLSGSENPRIQSNNHHLISTFGIGTDLNKTNWRSVFRQLIARGYLQVDVEGYGSIRLAEKCRDVLKGGKAIRFRQSTRKEKSSASKKRSKAALHELRISDQPLFDALKALRTDLAREQNVPPYVVFHDRTLIAMARNRPADTGELEKISGVGKVKLERYGDDFLFVIAANPVMDADNSTGEP
jgi:ATP-dependent DNA helicase RecQ